MKHSCSLHCSFNFIFCLGCSVVATHFKSVFVGFVWDGDMGCGRGGYGGSGGYMGGKVGEWRVYASVCVSVCLSV